MQSLWCCHQIFTKSVAQVHVYHTEGTLALREGTKVHIDVLPLGALLVCQFFEVSKEISLRLLLVEEIVTLVDDSLEATAAYRLGSCRKVEVVFLFHLVLWLGIDVDAKRLMADNFRALITIAWIICCSFFHCLQFTFSCRAHTLWYCIVQIHLSILLME